MIDISCERLISIDEAAKLIPGRDGGCVHPLTMERWTRPPGKRGVILESVLAGPRRCTSVEAIQRFLEACTRAAAGERQPARGIVTRTSRQAAAAVKKAIAELEAAGA
jgi:hypothetical protein